jgi:hypothetical protein
MEVTDAMQVADAMQVLNPDRLQGTLPGPDNHARECMVRKGRAPANLGRQPDPGVAYRTHVRGWRFPVRTNGLTTVVTATSSPRTLPNLTPT